MVQSWGQRRLETVVMIRLEEWEVGSCCAVHLHWSRVRDQLREC